MRTPHLALILVQSALVALSAADWPQEMGPDRSGSTDETIAVERLGAGLQPRWRASVGAGSAAPIVVGGRVYAVGLFKAGAEPGPATTPSLRGFPTHFKMEPDPDKRLRFDVYLTCVDQADGRLLWRCLVSPGEVLNVQAGLNAPPTWSDGLVVVRTPGAVIAVAADSGELRWRRDLVADGLIFTRYCGIELNGGGGFLEGRTPVLVHAGRLFFSGLSMDESRRPCALVVALDPLDGRTLWTWRATPYNSGPTWDPMQHSQETGYASHGPALNAGRIDGRETVVVATGHASIGLAAEDGARLWAFHHAEGLPAIQSFANDADISRPNPWGWWKRFGYPPPRPLIDGNIVVDRLFCGHGSLGSGTYAFSVENGTPRFLWYTDQLSSRWARFVLRDHRVYGMDLWGHNPHTIDSKTNRIVEWPRPRRPDGVGQFQCRDVRTGKLLWSSDAIYHSHGGESHLCEKGLGRPCPALSEADRDKPNEGGYSYEGEPMYVISGNVLIMRGYRMLPGIHFAVIDEKGLERRGTVEVDLGEIGFAEPVISGGDLFLRRFDEGPGGGTLLCLPVGAP